MVGERGKKVGERRNRALLRKEPASRQREIATTEAAASRPLAARGAAYIFFFLSTSPPPSVDVRRIEINSDYPPRNTSAAKRIVYSHYNLLTFSSRFNISAAPDGYPKRRDEKAG